MMFLFHLVCNASYLQCKMPFITQSNFLCLLHIIFAMVISQESNSFVVCMTIMFIVPLGEVLDHLANYNKSKDWALVHERELLVF